MKSIMLGMLASATAMAGLANAAPMDNFFNNTVVVTYPNKAQVKFLANPDNSYSAIAPDGSSTKGSWVVKGDKLCLTQTTPAAQPESCSPLVERKVGDNWTLPATDGSTVSLTLVAGR